jgi:hypothetical protein
LGGNIGAVYATIDMLRANKYVFHLRLMAVPALISKLSIYLRYESQLSEKGFARWTRMEDHDDRFEKIPSVVEQIFTSKPPDSARFCQRVLSKNNTIALKSSQVFFLDNNTFPTFVFLQDFNVSRNQLNESDTDFVIYTIKNIAGQIQERQGQLDDFKATIIQEANKISSNLKRKIVKTITNFN